MNRQFASLTLQGTLSEQASSGLISSIPFLPPIAPRNQQISIASGLLDGDRIPLTRRRRFYSLL